MSNYSETLKIAKDLQTDFNNRIPLVDALKVAAQIQQCNVLSNALLEGQDLSIQPLEAIAITLGFKPGNDTRSILSALQEISEKK